MSSGGPRDGPTKESTGELLRRASAQNQNYHFQGSVARKTDAHPTRTSLSFTDTETEILRKLARVLQKGIEHEDFADTKGRLLEYWSGITLIVVFLLLKDSRSGQEIEHPYTIEEYAGKTHALQFSPSWVVDADANSLAEEPSDEDKQKQLRDKLSALKFTNLPALKELVRLSSIYKRMRD